MLNCGYNDPLIAGDGFPLIRRQKQKENTEVRIQITAMEVFEPAEELVYLWRKKSDIVQSMV